MRIRAPRQEDLPAVVAVLTAVDIETLGEPDTTEKDIASGWQESGFDLSADAFVAEEGDELIGYGELYDRGRDVFDVDVYAHPDAPDEVAGALIEAVLDRASARAGNAAVLGTWVPVGDRRAAVYAGAGFQPVRQFVRMRHEGEPPAAADVPAGVVLRPFDRDADAAVVHRVLVDAFAHHARPMTPSLQRFTEQHLDHPDFDPRYWVVAQSDGRVVGAITAFNHGDIGFIRHVGVVAEQRGRGIGAALVLRALEVLAAAGQRRVDLGVDLDDQVGAAQLYERLGFRTLQRLELMERRL